MKNDILYEYVTVYSSHVLHPCFLLNISIRDPIAGQIFIFKIYSLHFSTQQNMCVYIPSGFSLYLNDQSL